MKVFSLIFLSLFISVGNIFAQEFGEGEANTTLDNDARSSLSIPENRPLPASADGAKLLELPPDEDADSYLPAEARAVLGGEKAKGKISGDFIVGFLVGGAFISFVAFFMFKFAKKSL